LRDASPGLRLLYLITLFAKNEQVSLSQSERNALAKMINILVEAWIER